MGSDCKVINEMDYFTEGMSVYELSKDKNVSIIQGTHTNLNIIRTSLFMMLW